MRLFTPYKRRKRNQETQQQQQQVQTTISQTHQASVMQHSPQTSNQAASQQQISNTINDLKKKKIITTSATTATQEYIQATPQANHTTTAIIQTIDGHHVDLNHLTSKDEAWQTITDGLDTSNEFVDQTSQCKYQIMFKNL